MVCLRCDQFLNWISGTAAPLKFHGMFEMVAWLFALKRQSQIVKMSEQNEFNFQMMVISLPFVCKVLEECRFGWGLSLFIVSLTLHRIVLFLFVFEVVDCTHEKKRHIKEIFGWNEFNFAITVYLLPFLYRRTWRAPFRLKVVNLIARFNRIYRGVLVHDFFDLARVLLRRRQKEKENIILKRLTEVKVNF